MNDLHSYFKYYLRDKYKEKLIQIDPDYSYPVELTFDTNDYIITHKVELEKQLIQLGIKFYKSRDIGYQMQDNMYEISMTFKSKEFCNED